MWLRRLAKKYKIVALLLVVAVALNTDTLALEPSPLRLRNWVIIN